ncbi:hypothetical protein BH09BAC5_BH09BAC5_16790 [soil metagenome]
MKKIIILASLTMFAFTQVKSQAFAGLGIGYGMPATGEVIGFNSNNNNPSNTYSTETVHGSYGTGLNAQGYFGYWFSEVIGAQLGVNYLMGKKYTFENNNVNNSNVSSNATDEVFARSLRLTPALRVGFGHGAVHPYMLGGFTIGMMNKLTDNYNETSLNPSGTNITVWNTEYTGGISLAPFAALGMNIHITEKLLFNAEITGFFANWAPTNGEVVTASYNGADQLGNMTTSQKQFEYVDKVDQSMNTSAGMPTQSLKSYLPMSSIGLTVGLHFEFGGTEPAK